MIASALLEATIFGVVLIVVVAVGVFWLTRQLTRLPSTDGRDRFAGALRRGLEQGLTPELEDQVNQHCAEGVAGLLDILQQILRDPTPEVEVLPVAQGLLDVLEGRVLSDSLTQTERQLAESILVRIHLAAPSSK